MEELIVQILVNTLFFHFEFNIENLVKKASEGLEAGKIKAKQTLTPPLWFFSRSRKLYHESLSVFKKTVTNFIEKRLDADHPIDDLLDNFIFEYRKLNRKELSDFLTDHIANMLIAGYLTTTGSLLWFLVMMSLHPTCEGLLLEEVGKHFKEKTPSYEDFKKMDYLTATLRETMRLHPSLHSIMRKAAEEDEIDGFRITKNAGIILSVPHIHRHPGFWDNPDGFSPARFLNNPMGQNHPFAFIPFGGGERACPAALFALMELQILCTMILQRFKLQLLSHSETSPCLTTIISNRPDIKNMCIKKR